MKLSNILLLTDEEREERKKCEGKKIGSYFQQIATQKQEQAITILSAFSELEIFCARTITSLEHR